jgi:uncharacterized membrane protein YphA (DoxX/SURF4 family)
LQENPLPRTQAEPAPDHDLALAGVCGQPRALPAGPWTHALTGLYHCLRLALAGVFIYAGAVKLSDPRAFAHAIAQYDLAPEALLPLLALGLPALEILAGLGLILEVRGSLGLTAILLLFFLAVLGYAILQDLDIDCGCFTPAELDARQGLRLAWWRDLAMLGTSIFLYRCRRRRSPRALWVNKLTISLKGDART